MNLERLKVIIKDKDKSSMTEWMEVNTELTKVLNSDKEFFKYAESKAKETKKANVGVIDLFQMTELYISYMEKDEAYTKYVESNKPKAKAETSKDNEQSGSEEQVDKVVETELQVPLVATDKPRRKRRTKVEIEASKQDIEQVIIPINSSEEHLVKVVDIVGNEIADLIKLPEMNDEIPSTPSPKLTTIYEDLY